MEFLQGKAGGTVTSGLNQFLKPIISFPDTYGNLSGLTSRWVASASGTNEYYYNYNAPEPLNILYSGSAVTQGTVGSLVNHTWGYADNDSLGQETIYVRDDDGNPDSLAVNLWMSDYWNIAGGTFAFGTEEDISATGSPLQLDTSEDQGFVCRLSEVPENANYIKMSFAMRLANRIFSYAGGNVSFIAKQRVLKNGGFTKTESLYLTTSGGTIENKLKYGAYILIPMSEVTAQQAQVPEICLIMDTSESVAENLIIDLDSIQYKYTETP